MINRNGSGKTHTQFGVVCVRFVFSDVKAPSGTRFVFAHCIYIYILHTYTYTLRKRDWHSGGVCACINVCVCVCAYFAV